MAKNDFTPNELKTEKWRDVPGYEGWYQVSNIGRVKRIAAGRGTRVGRILKPNNNLGYLAVYLVSGSKASKRGFLIHRLVIAAFIGPAPVGYECNHKNGIKTDNRVSNLEYCTPKENIQHSIRVLGNSKTNKNLRKLTTANVLDIRRLLAAGLARRQIAQMHNVSLATITLIATGKIWKNI